ncbi:MAG: cation diffusion facilitator family transporter [Kiritimatiellae bacterium]|nr:cation diffusion facilitator family transporter [Kiritimatiellia bacterium]MDW8457950.1 cation diffusion facilitator family transporter [Verrucomicrobiota bacterium]
MSAPNPSEPRSTPAPELWVLRLSLAVGVGMLAMKAAAYAITGSAAIFSDAAESVVHNVAVGFALFSLWYSARPADRTHLYGHDKIDFFSAGFEGAMIIVAALYIVYEAARKWITGFELENLSSGLWLTAAAFAINGALGGFLVWRGKRTGSLIVEANGRHVLTDSWTSLGVIAGLGLAWLTGWKALDPICAIAVALNILWSGAHLIRRSFKGLMDEASPADDHAIRDVLAQELGRYGAQYHDLKHRRTGRTLWVELHLMLPDDTPLWLAHAQATEIEEAIERRLGDGTQVITHLEPAHDHARVHRERLKAD